MSRADDPQFDFKKPEDNIKKWQPKKWEATAFQGVSPTDFFVRQNNEKKKMREKERENQAKMYNYKSKGMSDEERFARKVNNQHDKEKQAARDEIERAKHVTVTATAETEIRKNQHEQNLDWKKTQKEEKAKNNQFDMARSLFGGQGGGEEEGGEEEEGGDEEMEQQEE